MNLYEPYRAKIVDRIDETPDTRTLRLELSDPEVASSFTLKAGQFGE